MSKQDLLLILKIFLIWRIGVLLVALFAIRFIPVFSHNFFGGGYSNYILNPLFLGHVNFDGEHYLSIAQNGYQPIEYFFFPLFPYLIHLLTITRTQAGYIWVGLFVSNFSFFLAMVGIYKLVKIDYSQKIATLTIILFAIFPTSFYFGAYYTESLFLLLVVWTFYFMRNKNFLLASIIAAFASATRVIGAVLFVALIIEFLNERKYKLKISDIKNFWPIIISPAGVLYYMYFLLKRTGDPFIFLHQISVFGQQRSSTLILLPQVLYRYIFEILPSVNYLYFPNVFTSYFEFIAAILFLSLIVYSFFKLRLSYSFFAIFAFLIPTLAGSFSSMPRYVLAIFPVFILSASFLGKLPKIYLYLIFSVMILLLSYSEIMFWRGYWLS